MSYAEFKIDIEAETRRVVCQGLEVEGKQDGVNPTAQISSYVKLINPRDIL
jgi:hypothetical protein